MKKYLLTILALAALGLAKAGAEEFVLGGCNHKVMTANGFGSDNAGHLAAAMYIPGEKLKALAGNEIERLDVGFVSRINLRDVSIWVRKSLDGPNVAVETVERPSSGWNTVKFTTPYVIEEGIDGLYVGYDFESAGTSHPVSFAGNGEDYTSYLKVGDGAWENMSARGALSIEAIVTGNNLPQYDLAFINGKIFPDVAAGDNMYVMEGEVSNVALRDISGFTVSVIKEGDLCAEVHVSVDVPKDKKVKFSVPFDSNKALNGEVSLIITSLDGATDANDSNNAVTAKVTFPKNVVVEEFTTEMCPNCPEPGQWFNNVLNSDPSYHNHVVPICHHSAFGTDWLTRDVDTEILWLFDMGGQTFAPAAMFNRHAAFMKGYTQTKYEPIVALRSQKDFEDCIKSELQEETHAMVGMAIADKRTADNGASEYDVKVTVVTDDSFSLKNPILVFYTLENEIKAQKQQGASGTYYHHHVIRTDNGSYGEEINIMPGGKFEKVFTVTLDPEWKENDLYFAAFVANKNPDRVNDNVIENSAVLYIEDIPASVNGFQSSAPQEKVRYDIHGLKHEGEFEGLNIIVFTDGSVKKVFIK